MITGAGAIRATEALDAGLQDSTGKAEAVAQCGDHDGLVQVL